ncbi:hypothetical protein HID58_088153, partial [Brassica napus]
EKCSQARATRFTWVPTKIYGSLSPTNTSPTVTTLHLPHQPSTSVDVYSTYLLCTLVNLSSPHHLEMAHQQRLTAAEKGKGIIQDEPEGPRKRIRAPEFDYSDLEIPITFEYENMANHCSICNMLTHSSRNCDRRQKYTASIPNATSESKIKNRESRDPVSRRYSSQTRRSPPPRRALSPSSRNPNHSDAAFNQKVDRHVTLKTSMVPPLKNKITPTTSRLSIGGHQEQRPHGESFYEKARGTNLQWRARERPQSQPKTPQGNTRSPPASEAPLSRNLYNYDFPPRPTIPTTEEVLAELQDVTIQYINCADPTESAARRLRVTQGEQQNLMANTVAGIIEAATATANFIAGAPQNTAGPTIILPDPRAVTQDTVLVDSSCSHPVASAPSKRRGRPPGTKKMAASPKNLLGASSRKHNFARIQSSLAKNCD